MVNSRETGRASHILCGAKAELNDESIQKTAAMTQFMKRSLKEEIRRLRVSDVKVQIPDRQCSIYDERLLEKRSCDSCAPTSATHVFLHSIAASPTVAEVEMSLDTMSLEVARPALVTRLPVEGRRQNVLPSAFPSPRALKPSSP
jgi:hypothetical protein